MEDLKTRIAVLWIFMAVAMSAHSILMFMEPGIIEQMISGEIWAGMDPEQALFMVTLFWLIPLIMAFLSVTLKGSVNRWTNMIVGIVFTIINIWHITEPCCNLAHQKLLIAFTIIVTALVVWYAYKWPKQEK